MRSMPIHYNKTGRIRGACAFEKFLKREGEGGGDRDNDMTVPLDDCIDGVALVARQAIIMGIRRARWTVVKG
jgi:hypothetical protein